MNPATEERRIPERLDSELIAIGKPKSSAEGLSGDEAYRLGVLSLPPVRPSVGLDTF